MKKENNSWSIIILCYNEAGTIHGLVEKIFQVFRGKIFEIIIVDDGSSDNSPNIIKKIEVSHKCVLGIYHFKNKGIGSALKAGYSAAQKENITVIPGDGQFDVNELIPYFTVEPNTMVSFYRLENQSYTWFRNELSSINRLINKYFLGLNLKDVNWVKIYKQSDIKQLRLAMNSSIVESEICAKLISNGVRCIQVASVYHARTYGKSKGASFRTVMQALRETLKLIYEIFKFKRGF